MAAREARTPVPLREPAIGDVIHNYVDALRAFPAWRRRLSDL
jgi:hypothetical protein